jgi:toxin-antitoxin system PIN domain toxin
VILIDANLLIYAYSSNFAQHATTREWFDRQINGSARVGLPWASLLAFLRITTNPRMFARPLPMAKAWEQVSIWLACETVWTPVPTDRHAGVLATLLAQRGVHGNLVSDAHLAALAIEHGLTLCSADGDFARFASLRWHNPLAPT